jgi:pyruvate,orthophosphate dikinase
MASSQVRSAAACAADQRFVFDFGEGSRDDTAILGGKGAGLAHMMSLGLPVPPGFTVSCRAGLEFLAAGELPLTARDEILTHLDALEQAIGRRLGDPEAPLLVSVRSGAPVSMPGMMDTILNVGLDADTVLALARQTGGEAFAWGSYERFVESYARIVRGISGGAIEECLLDLESTGDDAPSRTTEALLALIESEDGVPLPSDPRDQILEAIGAVYRSWDSPRAKTYRRFRGIDDGLCTAATVQAMVFGNRGSTSASGVAFTRDPSSGTPEAFGDILFDAQGEDVVAGERDAEPLSTLAKRLPEVHATLKRALSLIESDACDLCEVEFTIEEGALWILQTRIGLRSGRAAVRVAVDMVSEGRISQEVAIARVTPAQLEAAAAPGFASEPTAEEIIERGLAASPGAAVGRIVFDAARATELAANGAEVILMRPTTAPSDVAGFIAARGIVTGRGGRTSHAAVVARGMQRPAVCGVGMITISNDRRSAALTDTLLREGDSVAVDGDRGLLLRGSPELDAPASTPTVLTLLAWCTARGRVPHLTETDIATMPVVDTVEALAESENAVVLNLLDPDALVPATVARAIADHHGPPPVLRISSEWLRAADARFSGTVRGLVVSDDARSGELLSAVLSPA